jgi:dTMP kinase
MYRCSRRSRSNALAVCRVPPSPPAISSSGDATEARPLTRGTFITLEGGEGAGKSSHQKSIVAALGAALAGVKVIGTREPGDATGADEIRNLLLNGPPDRWDAVSEALLMVAARRSHLVETVLPALDRGDWVVCDRFVDSTTAYQGNGGGVPLDQLASLHRMIAGDLMPDLTLILDVPVEIGLARAEARCGGETRFERKGAAFHTAVRQGFLDIAKREPKRCVVIDASKSLNEVGAAILAAVRDRLGVAV